MELLQRAPPILGWAAITLRIGPHSSSLAYATYRVRAGGRIAGARHSANTRGIDRRSVSEITVWAC